MIEIEQADGIEPRPFRKEDIDKFENALDFLFFRGFQDEIINTEYTKNSKNIMYAVVRASEEFKDKITKFGDIMVRLELRGDRSDLTFWKPLRPEDIKKEKHDRLSIEDTIEPIPISEILSLEILDKS